MITSVRAKMDAGKTRIDALHEYELELVRELEEIAPINTERAEAIVKLLEMVKREKGRILWRLIP